MASSKNYKDACRRRCVSRCLLYPSELRLLGGFLMFFAGILVLAFGMSYLLPYVSTLDFQTATCTTVRVDVPDGPSEHRSCRCYDDDNKCSNHFNHKNYAHVTVTERFRTAIEIGGTNSRVKTEQAKGYSSSQLWKKFITRDIEANEKKEMCQPLCSNDLCYSCFPCVRIWVDYISADRKFSYVNGTLRKSRGIILETANWPEINECFHVSCDDRVYNNEYAVMASIRPYAQVGREYTCFYDRLNYDRVMAERVRTHEVIHSMLWPGLAFLAGITILPASFIVACRNKATRKRGATARKMALSHRAMCGNQSHLTGKDSSEVTEQLGAQSPETVYTPKYVVHPPNIPLSENAQSSPMFSLGQSRLVGQQAEKSPRPTPGKHRRVSVIEITGDEPDGQTTNLVFVVRDPGKFDPRHTPSPGEPIKMKTVAYREPDGVSPNSSSLDNSYSSPTNFNSPGMLDKRFRRKVSAVSTRSEGIYPPNFNPPFLINANHKAKAERGHWMESQQQYDTTEEVQDCEMCTELSDLSNTEFPTDDHRILETVQGDFDQGDPGQGPTVQGDGAGGDTTQQGSVEENISKTDPTPESDFNGSTIHVDVGRMPRDAGQIGERGDLDYDHIRAAPAKGRSEASRL